MDQEGYEKLFNQIVKDYSERLYWHVRHMVVSHEDTDDLLQEIFMKIWAALPSFRGESQLFTWVYRIATNEALNFLNKKKVRAALSFESLGVSLARTAEADPYFNGGKAEIELSKAIASLPKRQRMVFIMRYYEDLSYEEISAILGISTGALKASYHIAYEKIKLFLTNNV